MSLNDDLVTDGAAFVDTDVFGESATFTPWTAGAYGTPRTIKVIVDRNPRSRPPEDARTRKINVQVAIRNHATLGATSFELGRDRLSISERYGGTADTYIIQRVIEGDAGMWIVELM